MRKGRFRNINPLKWVGWLFTPIVRNGAFFVFMFALGWMCTQLELMPYYLRERGAKPYELTLPELFLDIYVLCVFLTLIPRKIRLWVKALLYIFLYGVAIVDVFCYVRFESTLTPTMLMLVAETSSQEAREFLSGYLSFAILMTSVGWILLLMLIHIIWTFIRRRLNNARRLMVLPKLNEGVVIGIQAVLGCLVAWCLYSSISQTWNNKVAVRRLFSCATLGDVEREQNRKDHAKLYLPVYRLAFGIYANSLADQQLEQLEIAGGDQIQIDSCCFRIPDIVLVIGESYNKHHSQLYGYDKPTTPRQRTMAEEGSLVPFSDVVSSWNLTSFVFKHMLSLWAVGDSGAWCDKPLFPEVFRRAGYHVTFLTNQFLPHAKEAVYDFSGGFFLSDSVLSRRFFDERNTTLYRYDDGLLKELQQRDGKGRLTILHLMGSHVDYSARYPKAFRQFTPQQYNRPELTPKQLQTLAHYDNSLLYNDSILKAVTRHFADRDAVVIYVPDHGEEVFDSEPYTSGRLHNADIDYRLARNEMEIPFWIWGSPLYRKNHPYGWRAIQAAKDRPLMIDALPHLLLYLGGISTPLYRSELNIISPDYNVNRPRILKGTTDYDSLKQSNHKVLGDAKRQSRAQSSKFKVQSSK
ncbi:MAG: phosphoethanolamine transferase [Prevotella sp.]|nr:phosphoethanolamine transferase [Prevotella sp.]MBR2229826.1 phosphoethanolamine transferase [Prevotella sp.]